MYQPNSLVIFKYQPAVIKAIDGDKYEIITPNGKSRKVREKDFYFLHEGPLKSLDQLAVIEGDKEEAWELLQGETVEFKELSELIFSEDSPNALWSTWQIVQDRLHFKFNGDFDAIEVTTHEEVEKTLTEREAKERAAREWEEFSDRLKKGQLVEDDKKYLQEVEKLALGQVKKCRVLQLVGKEQTPENAHSMLLKFKYWDQYNNPYPYRAGLPEANPDIVVPPLPEEERLDLTHLPAFAIDDEGNTDPDDAISLDGDYLWVHVADAAALVTPGSELDEEAMARGTNQYLPERVVTMLPESIVDMLGLGIQETSPALSFGMRVDEDGNLSDVKITPSWVKVQRISYKACDSRIDEPQFKAILEKTECYRRKRIRNGAPVIRLPEVKVKLGDDNKVEVTQFEQLVSREMVTDAMLMAGEAAAMFASENEIAIPYATQQMNAEVATNEHVPKIHADEPEKDVAAMFARRKLFKRSQMKTIPGEHAGLGMPVYARATSPMRRYPDLVVHQQIRAFLNDLPVMDENEIMIRVASFESVAGSAAQSERLSREHWKAVYLLDQDNWSGEGIVADVNDGRYTIVIPELGMEPRMRLNKDLPLNSRVRVAFNSVDIPMLGFHFKFEEVVEG